MASTTEQLKGLNKTSSIYVGRVNKDIFKNMMSIKNDKITYYGTTQERKVYKAAEKSDNMHLLFQQYLTVSSKKFLNGMILQTNPWDGMVEVGAVLGNTRYLMDNGFVILYDKSKFIKAQHDDILSATKRFSADNQFYIEEKERFDLESENLKSIKKKNKLLKKGCKSVLKDKETEEIYLSDEKLTGEELRTFQDRVVEMGYTIEEMFDDEKAEKAIMYHEPEVREIRIKKPSIYGMSWSIKMDSYFKIISKFEIYSFDNGVEDTYILIKRKEPIQKNLETIMDIKPLVSKVLSDFDFPRGIKPDKWRETSVSIDLMDLKMQNKENSKLMNNLYDSLTFNSDMDDEEVLPFACEPSVVNSIEMLFSGEINGEMELYGQPHLIKGFSKKELSVKVQNGERIETEMIKNTLYTYNLNTCELERQI